MVKYNLLIVALHFYYYYFQFLSIDNRWKILLCVAVFLTHWVIVVFLYLFIYLYFFVCCGCDVGVIQFLSSYWSNTKSVTKGKWRTKKVSQWRFLLLQRGLFSSRLTSPFFLGGVLSPPFSLVWWLEFFSLDKPSSSSSFLVKKRSVLNFSLFFFLFLVLKKKKWKRGIKKVATHIHSFHISQVFSLSKEFYELFSLFFLSSLFSIFIAIFPNTQSNAKIFFYWGFFAFKKVVNHCLCFQQLPTYIFCAEYAEYAECTRDRNRMLCCSANTRTSQGRSSWPCSNEIESRFAFSPKFIFDWAE